VAIPDPSINTQTQGGDSAFENVFVFGQLNYDFDREGWLRRLAMSHWRLDEIRSGECWRHMKQWVKR